MERKLFVGDVVELKVSILANDIGARGVVVDEYDLGWGAGAQLIFANGETDGFSPNEQEEMLVKVGHVEALASYQFQNVMKLSQDYHAGKFVSAFSNWKE